MAVVVVDEDTLEQLIMRAVAKAMGRPMDKLGMASVEHEQEEMNTRNAKKLLAGKGYQVKSSVGFNAVITEHKIGRVKRGREFWYKTDDLNKLPSRY